MMRRHLATGIVFACALLAQNSPTPRGTEPKAKPGDYPVQGSAGPIEIAADFMVHTYGAQGQNFFTEEYLIVEVALYSAASEPSVVAANHFRLRVNGKKQTLLPDSPGMVANSIKYEDWESRRAVIGVAGAEDGGVVVGRPQQTERFPGDPRPGQSRLPAPPKAPTSKPGGVEAAAPPLTPAEAAVEGHLPEGTLKLPVSGYLFFRFGGKVKSADLLYEGPHGTATLVLKRKS
jgi:hypothetical protein